MAVDTVKKVKINVDVKTPKLYQVVYFNDEKTPAIFVAETLIQIFNYDVEKAVALTETISNSGSGIAVGGVSKELATHLKDLVMVAAQVAKYPLKVEVKQE
jgi:ATP-dependent Clp protease adapter protein ClpS